MYEICAFDLAMLAALCGGIGAFVGAAGICLLAGLLAGRKKDDWGRRF